MDGLPAWLIHLVQIFGVFYATRQNRGIEATTDPLVMSADGKGIVMRKEGLREGTRKAVEQAQLRARLSPGQKKNRKRMASGWR